jgi:hypothetical protein
MERHEVVVKRLVSSDGKVVAEAKSVAKTSGNGQTEISHDISVNVSSDGNSSRSSQSGYISVSSTN